MGNTMAIRFSQGEGEESAIANYIQRLSTQEVKLYTEGFRRITHGDAIENASSSIQSTESTRNSTKVSTASSQQSKTNSKQNDANKSKVSPNGVSNSTLLPGITKRVFRNKVLAGFTMIPQALSDRLFDVLDRDSSGQLKLENLLYGISWLKHGTFEERMQLLFIIYDLENQGVVTREIINRFMDVIYGRPRARSETSVKLLNLAFQNSRETNCLEVDEFLSVVQMKDEYGDALLLLWFDVLTKSIGVQETPEIAELENKYNPVAVRHRIAENTIFSVTEVAMLEKKFQYIFDIKGGASNRITTKKFITTLVASKLFPRNLLEQICKKTSVPNCILFDEFCVLVSNLCRGDDRTKCKHLFAYYSEPKKENPHDGEEPPDVITSQAIDELIELGCEYCEFSVQNYDKTKEFPDGIQSLDCQSFINWANHVEPVTQLLHQLAFGACILFSLLPETPTLEKRVIEWQWTQAADKLAVGQNWNLIATKWWHSWCQHVGMSKTNGTPTGILSIPPIPDEALEKSHGMIQEYDNFTNQTSSKTRKSLPGPIANWDLLKRSGSRRLRENLIIGCDFHIVPANVYDSLVLWHSGAPNLQRSIIEVSNGNLQLELFPLVLRVARVDMLTGGVVMSGEEVLLSRLSTPTQILHLACKVLLLSKNVDKARLWYFDENQPEIKTLIRPHKFHDLEALTQDSVFLVEIQDDDGSWPLHAFSPQLSDELNYSPENDANNKLSEEDDKPVTVTTTEKGFIGQKRRNTNLTSEICARGNFGESLSALTNSTRSGTISSKAAVKTPSDLDKESDISPTSTSSQTSISTESTAAANTIKRRFSKDAFNGDGLVGLNNLGNTCYMSSALQCLSHTRLLVDYFKNEAYLTDINLHNRDGTNGRLAVAFGELLRVLWTLDKKRYSPDSFKKVLSRFNPQFMGYDQHDAQELLACLLSSLSEDLNRVISKPYIEQPDSNGRPDTLVADEWWSNHLKREISVIVALFTGQYKSLLECSICGYESARFEPFTFLQLSLPDSAYRSLTLTIFFSTDRVPVRYSVRVRKDGTVQDIHDQVLAYIRKVVSNDGLGDLSANATSSSMLPNSPAMDIIIARTSNMHTVDAILSNSMSLLSIHDKDQLSAFEIDPIDGGGDEATTPASNDSGQEESTSKQFPLGSSVYVSGDKVRDQSTGRIIGCNYANQTVDVAFSNGARRYYISFNKITLRTETSTPLFFLHRRVDQMPMGFTHSHGTRQFGAPLVLGVSLGNTSTLDLYLYVWRRLKRIFNWQSPPPSSSFDDIDKMIESHKKFMNKVKSQSHVSGTIPTLLSDIALGRHLALTHFGFCLRLVTCNGSGCSRCEWLEACVGCLILPSSNQKVELAAEETLAIDWDIRTLKEDYDPIQAAKIHEDISVKKNHQRDNQSLSLKHCMDIFTTEEQIPEAFCSSCKTLRPATKFMDLWRLPPILVIQLKRFCYTQTSRRKLHHLVEFPLVGLDLEDYLAPKRKRRRKDRPNLSPVTISLLNAWLYLGGKLHSETVEFEKEDIEEMSSNVSLTENNVLIENGHCIEHEPLTPSPLLNAPASAACMIKNGESPPLYDLYAVVNHVGALGAGHYFACTLSDKDNKWRIFNDHQCTEISAKEVISSNAYILFYRRRDLNNEPIEELFPPSAQLLRRDSDSDGLRAKKEVEDLLLESKISSSNGNSCNIS